MQPLANRDLTERVIGAAIDVHRTLGPGFVESVYEQALCVEFDACGIGYERQKVVRVYYRGRPVGEHRIDLFVEESAVVELKAAKGIEDVHFAYVRSYMKALSVDCGLILNFAAMPLTVKRVGPERRNCYS